MSKELLCGGCGERIDNIEDAKVAWVDHYDEAWGLMFLHARHDCMSHAGFTRVSIAGVSVKAVDLITFVRRDGDLVVWDEGHLRFMESEYCMGVNDKIRAAVACFSVPTRAKASNKDTWDEDSPVGVKRQRLVKWLMSKKGVSLDKAKLIASRKYRY